MSKTNRLSLSRISRPLGDARGQTLGEYALVLAFISIVTISAMAATSGHVRGVFTSINNQVAVAGNGGPLPTPPPNQGQGGG